jgi:hypothetical protein
MRNKRTSHRRSTTSFVTDEELRQYYIKCRLVSHPVTGVRYLTDDTLVFENRPPYNIKYKLGSDGSFQDINV